MLGNGDGQHLLGSLPGVILRLPMMADSLSLSFDNGAPRIGDDLVPLIEFNGLVHHTELLLGAPVSLLPYVRLLFPGLE